jgi:hypothetical protein
LPASDNNITFAAMDIICFLVSAWLRSGVLAPFSTLKYFTNQRLLGEVPLSGSTALTQFGIPANVGGRLLETVRFPERMDVDITFFDVDSSGNLSVPTRDRPCAAMPAAGSRCWLPWRGRVRSSPSYPAVRLIGKVIAHRVVVGTVFCLV